MNDKLKKFLESIAKVLGVEVSTVISLFNDDGTPKDEASQKIIETDRKRIEKISADHAAEMSRAVTDKASGVKREEREFFENGIKKAFNLTTDKVGLELVDVALAEAKKSVNKDGEIDETKIKSSKQWIDREVEFNKQLADAKVKADEDLTKERSAFEQKEIITSAEKQIMQMIEDSGAVLPDKEKNKDAYNTQLNHFMTAIKNDLKFQKVKDSDVLIPLDKDGKPLVNEHKNAVDFATAISERISKTWPIEASKAKNSANPPKTETGAGGAGGKKYVSVVPKVATDKQGYISDIQKIRASALSPEDKTKAQEEYLTDYTAATAQQ